MAEGEAADDLARGRKLAQADNLDDAADAFGAALEKRCAVVTNLYPQAQKFERVGVFSRA
jgi:hypothetical protein